MPVGEDTLIAARGLNPNYLSYNATYICCFSNDVGAEVCDCTDWPRNTVCIYCSGFGALSGNYSAGKGGSVQPSGGSVDCNLTMQLFIGVCDGGIDCDFAVPIGACGGTYPTFTFQSTMNEGESTGAQRRLAIATVNRR